MNWKTSLDESTLSWVCATAGAIAFFIACFLQAQGIDSGQLLIGAGDMVLVGIWYELRAKNEKARE